MASRAPWKLLLAGRRSPHLPSLSLCLYKRERKRLSCHFISLTYFLCHLHIYIYFFLTHTQSFKGDLCFEREPDRIMRGIQYAESYEVAFHFPPEHYTVVICNDSGADGTNTSSEGRRFCVASSSAHNVQHKHHNLPACFEYACN